MHTDDEWNTVIQDVSVAVDSSRPQIAISAKDLAATTLAKTIDHTLLKLDATADQITDLCKEATQYDFAAVCVRVNFVAHAVQQLKGSSGAGKSNIKVACVVGFHEGTPSTASKVSESQEAIAAGASELDVVVNRDTLQGGDLAGVYEELKAIRAVAPPSVTLKLILETSQLSTDEIVAAGVLAGYAGFDFIKTSTGFCGHGATVQHVLLMSKIADVVSQRGDLGEFKGKKMKVKASGGVRSLDEAKKMIEVGAERIGTSSGVKIMKDFSGETKGESGNATAGGY